jgi:spermidine/putrescine transport system substrate-binding protein
MLMNYYYQPTVAASGRRLCQLHLPGARCAGGDAETDPELAKSNWIFPNEATLNNSQVFRPLTPQEQAEYSKAFGNVIQG